MRKISALLSLDSVAEELVSSAREKNITLGTAESCTGGLISAVITDVAGASAVFFGGIVSYDNSVKRGILGVRPETLAAHGAVSHETAAEMARGAVHALGVDLACSVTGIAGPGGGTPEKPVGLVYVAVANKDGILEVKENRFSGDRSEIRRETAETALCMLLSAVNDI